MEAAVIILIIVIAIGLIFGGIALRQHIEERYEFDIFSGGKIFMACVALAMLLISAYIYDEAGATITDNVVVLLVVAAIIYIALFIMYLQKIPPHFALLAVFYQILISTTIILVLFIALLYLNSDNKKKR